MMMWAHTTLRTGLNDLNGGSPSKNSYQLSAVSHQLKTNKKTVSYQLSAISSRLIKKQ
jgi:hypothetical protein